jgi:hypothetical protein
LRRSELGLDPRDAQVAEPVLEDRRRRPVERARVAARTVGVRVQPEVGRAGDEEPRGDEEDHGEQEDRSDARPHGGRRYPPGSPAASGGGTAGRSQGSRGMTRPIERAYLAVLAALVGLLVRIVLDP